MNYPLVSVIIPVYQAEKFLRECLESVGMQDYPELEIILVNDGSTDRSPEICAKSARADKRIQIRRMQAVQRPGMQGLLRRRESIFFFWMQTINWMRKMRYVLW